MHADIISKVLSGNIRLWKAILTSTKFTEVSMSVKREMRALVSKLNVNIMGAYL